MIKKTLIAIAASSIALPAFAFIQIDEDKETKSNTEISERRDEFISLPAFLDLDDDSADLDSLEVDAQSTPYEVSCVYTRPFASDDGTTTTVVYSKNSLEMTGSGKFSVNVDPKAGVQVVAPGFEEPITLCDLTFDPA